MIRKIIRTRQEIGRIGGNTRAAIYSTKELSEQSTKGANTLKKLRPGFHAKIGSIGGNARFYKYSHEELSLQSQKSAATTEKKYPGFYSKIGSKGGKNRIKNNIEKKKEMMNS